MRSECMKIFQVDSFTSKPFTGNPAGVCILSGNIPDFDMLKIANEMFEAFQLSERGGVVRVKVVLKSNRVILSDRAVTVIKGELVYGC